MCMRLYLLTARRCHATLAAVTCRSQWTRWQMQKSPPTRRARRRCSEKRVMRSRRTVAAWALPMSGRSECPGYVCQGGSCSRAWLRTRYTCAMASTNADHATVMLLLCLPCRLNDHRMVGVLLHNLNALASLYLRAIGIVVCIRTSYPICVADRQLAESCIVHCYLRLRKRKSGGRAPA